MDCLKGYVMSLRFEKINQKVGINSSNFEKIVVFDENKNFFKDEKTREFYQKYEKELNSYKMDDLMKIFKETGICVYRILRCLQDKDNFNGKEIATGGFVIQPTSIYYWNSEDYPKVEYKYVKKEYRKQEKKLSKLQDRELELGDDMCLNQGEYEYFFLDMEFVTYVDKLGKDNIGIYIVNNNKKEYVCLFKEIEEV